MKGFAIPFNDDYPPLPLLLLCFFPYLILTAQPLKLNYKIISNGSDIGIINAEKWSNQGTVTYNLHTEVITEKLIKINLKYILKSRYTNGKLVYSFMQNFSNGKEQSYAEVKWEENSYFTRTHEDAPMKPLSSKPIIYSVGRLYFDEPKKIDSVYSEKYSKHVPITSLGGGKYELKLPDGKNIYHYNSNGICNKVEVNNFLAKLIFELME